jgi:hypothetical protein
LVERSPRSSLFHTREWVAALHRTYGYEPVVYTNADRGCALDNALLFSRVNSWLTGRRLVSLPFSDHCDPLVDDPTTLDRMLEALKARMVDEGRYIELRPARTISPPDGYIPSARFVWHSIALDRSPAQLFASFHKSHTQRAVRKAERSGVTIEAGQSDSLLGAFYGLHTATRHRHGVPVQPYDWFQRLAEAFGDRLRIYAATYRARCIAAILVIRHKTTLVYKYGCSDLAHKQLGATPALFWRAIEDGVGSGCEVFDLGRSDADDQGLIAFKEHLGAAGRSLVYYRYSDKKAQAATRGLLIQRPHARASRLLIERLARTSCATRLYKHFA